MDILGFGIAHSLKVRLYRGELSIRGHAGRIIEDDDGDVRVEVDDNSVVDGGNGVLLLPVIDPADPLQAQLALEVIESRGHKKLTSDERRDKVKLLRRLRCNESDDRLLM
jgi:hypothetical protein